MDKEKKQSRGARKKETHSCRAREKGRFYGDGNLHGTIFLRALPQHPKKARQVQNEKQLRLFEIELESFSSASGRPSINDKDMKTQRG